ncbi:protein-methionine-sulfoxide reductase catalytic subunit MsrP [Rhodopila sp.]|jgi:sulfoxide reductase catalytic subunit YedY|uniref:protein-methionine-sulfoxide reductase catalytic subunit MsrP n=1 Tax=Rhodopila sp. TaxID=2480087 RepID=UPI002CB3A7B9|nr:protein-methionine-sulfoxide reductase catalytic subunit MsrP [Rhodopila sp.]HVZ10760.1 protein-methionine-sulfoxide reductase catalytic subunit MsrP [Rhodopila sp.]
MQVIRRRGWEIPEHRVTPEPIVLNRRAWLAAAGALAILPAIARADQPAAAAAGSAPVNPAFSNAGRAVTDAKYATTYNNYYEFGTDKSIWREAQALPQRPWTIRIDGMVGKPRTIGIDDLLAQIPQEERIYRHRCVEAWAMTVPWTGFPLSKLVKLADPLASARYVVFETAQDKSMPGLSDFYPWPYTEGVTIDEAANELAFISTGLYGKPLPPQNGGPIRLTLPWKYGFKSAKSIVRISFTDKRPATFWEALQASEYGFWANVNPAVPHPRWSQATERLLGTNERIPTQLFNGYADQVAALYAGLKNEKLFM